MRRTDSHPGQSAFTLIELLIVVTIMGVMIAALTVGIRGYLQRSDDAHRKTDIKKIARALEEYYNDHNGYPASLAVNGISPTCGTNTILRQYLPDVPCDPTGGSARPYLYLPEGSHYLGTFGSEQVYRGYRLLTALTFKSDPQLREVGCDVTTGCGGIPAVSGFPNLDKNAYNFGVAANAQVKSP